MFCGILLLYVVRLVVFLCMVVMSFELNWDKEIDVSFVVFMSRIVCI